MPQGMTYGQWLLTQMMPETGGGAPAPGQAQVPQSNYYGGQQFDPNIGSVEPNVLPGTSGPDQFTQLLQQYLTNPSGFLASNYDQGQPINTGPGAPVDPTAGFYPPGELFGNPVPPFSEPGPLPGTSDYPPPPGVQPDVAAGQLYDPFTGATTTGATVEDLNVPTGAAGLNAGPQSGLMQQVQNFVSGIPGAVIDAAGNIRDAAGNIISTVANFLGSIPGAMASSIPNNLGQFGQPVNPGYGLYQGSLLNSAPPTGGFYSTLSNPQGSWQSQFGTTPPGSSMGYVDPSQTGGATYVDSGGFVTTGGTPNFAPTYTGQDVSGVFGEAGGWNDPDRYHANPLFPGFSSDAAGGGRPPGRAQ